MRDHGLLLERKPAAPLAQQAHKGRVAVKESNWLITSCRSANNIMPITFFLPAFIASSFYSA
jgi:hypothetical protein